MHIYSAQVGTDGLVLQHQGIRSHSAEYAPLHFQIFMGYSFGWQDQNIPI